ncbi:MAG: hypothetical protein COU51_01760 [Parcubacteria group bacterium CG10_big_fil_rev_8_21_14_0_10_36_14]|nr:MAG: hypothetical protein COU51_01760 [Parcubacteria group bacterium CG10_big_fil_rev_8_21_14_0_10_36_14]
MRFLIILFLLIPFKALADSGHIVISEIQTYGETSKDEFVRLYNPTSSAIDISGWHLKKKTSSGSESNLVSSFEDETVIPANSGFLITHKTDYIGTETADTTWSGTSYSIADNNTILLYNNEDTLIDKVGFGETSDFEDAPAENPTKRASIKRQNNEDTNNNKVDFISTAKTEQDDSSLNNSPTPETMASASFEDVVINEVLPNPNEGKEWIEFYNTTSRIISIEGWEVCDGSNKIYTLLGAIYPNSFITIEINNRLNNSGDAIYLSDGNNFSIDQLIYGDWNGSEITAPQKGESIARQLDATYIISSVPTKNYENSIKSSLTESTDENQEKIEYTFSTSTINEIKKYIIISEILPNPEGSDATGEWVEFFNSSLDDINLGSLYLDDMEGGSNPYKIPNDTLIKTDGYLIFLREKTNLALNNTNDSVRLLDADKNEIMNIEYDDASEGLSYALLDDGWQWTSEPTPLSQNVIKKTTQQERSKTIFVSNSVTGMVIVPPNVFNTQIMYIDGRQLYMYYADWPEIKTGDKITAWGESSTYYGELRLKLKNKNSIKILSHNNILEPTNLTAFNIDDEMVGKLVSTEGEIIDTNSSKIFIDVNGTELLIYNKTKLDFSEYKERDTIKITGVLSKYNNEYRLLPRDENDISLTSQGVIEKSDASKDIAPFWQYFASTLVIGSIFGTIYLKRRKNERTTKTGTTQRVERREEAPF